MLQLFVKKFLFAEVSSIILFCHLHMRKIKAKVASVILGRLDSQLLISISFRYDNVVFFYSPLFFKEKCEVVLQDRKKSIQDIKTFLDTKIAPKEFVEELKVGSLPLLFLEQYYYLSLTSLISWKL